MKFKTALSSRLPAALFALAASLLLPTALSAADHGDAPALAQDQGADIADVFLFMSPDSMANDKVILIATFHGFITPGEAVNFGVFDPNIRYHFEIFNDHVNLPPPVFGSTKSKAAIAKDLAKVKANRTIDVTFSPRATDQTATVFNDSEKPLLGPVAQKANVTLTGFAPGTVKTFTDLPTTSATLSATPATQTVTTLTTTKGDIRFFAGIVDDPFFFDIPAFSALIKSKRETGSFDTTPLNRGRDTFAGYNILAIALEIPLSMVKGTNGNIIGADFMTQRHTIELKSSTGGVGHGAFKQIDRMGNPGVNVALVPFDKKNDYNGRTAKIDASLSKAGDILSVLKGLGVNTDLNATPLDPKLVTLASIAVIKGDILQLDTTVANTQTGAGGGGNNMQTGFGTAGGGRRLMDDTIDIVLSVLGSTGDNVAANQDTGFLPQNIFPFLHTPHQPIQTTGEPDDNTRN